MADPQKALATQIANIEAKTGKSLAELVKIVNASGLAKHGENRDMLKEKFSLGHGDANTIAHAARDPNLLVPKAAAPGDADAVVDELYAGPKAALRPIHDRLMAAIRKFGEFEIAPKKTYLSLRRKKQFAMIGPATKTQIEVGLNAKSLPASARLKVMPEKSMCGFTCRVGDVGEADAELVGWIKKAYDESG